MYTTIGTCPRCGAPIYTYAVWHAVTPPPPIYSCQCRLSMKEKPLAARIAENWPDKYGRSPGGKAFQHSGECITITTSGTGSD